MAVKTATEISVKALDDKLSTYAQDIDDKLSESRKIMIDYLHLHRDYIRNLPEIFKSMMFSRKKVLDSLDAIKNENQFVDSNLSTLETRLHEIEKSNESSNITHMKLVGTKNWNIALDKDL